MHSQHDPLLCRTTTSSPSVLLLLEFCSVSFSTALGEATAKTGWELEFQGSRNLVFIGVTLVAVGFLQLVTAEV